MRGGARVSSKLDFDNTGILITRLLSNSTNCQEYFQNQTFLSDSATLSTQIIGASETPLSIYMPGDTTNVVAKPGTKLTNQVTTSVLTIRDLVFQSTDNYLAKVHLEATDSNSPLPLVRDFPITLQTLDVPGSSPPAKKITDCRAASSGFDPEYDSNWVFVASTGTTWSKDLVFSHGLGQRPRNVVVWFSTSATVPDNSSAVYVVNFNSAHTGWNNPAEIRIDSSNITIRFISVGYQTVFTTWNLNGSWTRRPNGYFRVFAWK